MRVARVFPRKTKALPQDRWAFVGPPGPWTPEVDAVHISVTFTYDLPLVDDLQAAWSPRAPVVVGGPALGQPSGNFVPGMYLRRGYVITSRGCPNRCWFCSVWRREGPEVRELPVTDGWNVLDDNLLATSRGHFSDVVTMLSRQPKPAEFTGGLDPALLTQWHVDLLAGIRVKQVFLAYDTPSDREPLVDAVRLLTPVFGGRGGKRGRKLRCYVLVGWDGDTFEAAEERLKFTGRLGLFPMAMLLRDEAGGTEKPWRQFQRSWAAPPAVATQLRGVPVDLV